MERLDRKPFQGVLNIVRFNWHFYLIAGLIIGALISLSLLLPNNTINKLIVLLTIGISVPIFISLATSYYVYDFSNLYSLQWLPSTFKDGAKLVNINAGFDETSHLLMHKYPTSILKIFDFYDSHKHTEVSIERARKAYPAYQGTEIIQTDRIPLASNSTDVFFLILAVHEIRNKAEQIIFFEQLKNSLTQEGRIIVVEHSRDWLNFIAYNIGFLHFFSQQHWRKTFDNAGLFIHSENKITPFITTYTLSKHGDSN